METRTWGGGDQRCGRKEEKQINCIFSDIRLEENPEHLINWTNLTCSIGLLLYLYHCSF